MECIKAHDRVKHSTELVYLNLSLILISSSGLLGRLVSLSPELTILYRCVLAAALLFIYLRYKKIKPLRTKLIYPKYLLLGGVLMAIHWVGYFYALGLSSIAIAMLTLHTHPAITSILEPIILKTRFKSYHLLLAGVVLLGIWFIMPEFNIKNKLVLAIICGIVSALSFSLRNIWTRKIMPHYNASQIMFYNLVVMVIILFPFVFIQDSSAIRTDWSYIVALAVFTTAIGHTLFVNALKHFSASTVSLLSSIIPIYGIIWGVLFLSEVPDKNTIIGGMLILSSFVIESYISQRKIKQLQNA